MLLVVSVKQDVSRSALNLLEKLVLIYLILQFYSSEECASDGFFLISVSGQGIKASFSF